LQTATTWNSGTALDTSSLPSSGIMTGREIIMNEFSFNPIVIVFLKETNANGGVAIRMTTTGMGLDNATVVANMAGCDNIVPPASIDTSMNALAQWETFQGIRAVELGDGATGVLPNADPQAVSYWRSAVDPTTNQTVIMARVAPRRPTTRVR
jgi:hypothetical protein